MIWVTTLCGKRREEKIKDDDEGLRQILLTDKDTRRERGKEGEKKERMDII